MAVIIGYLGPSGSYSEAVCHGLYPPSKHPAWQFHEYPTLAMLMHAIANKHLTFAVIPVENTKSGLLDDNEGHELFAQIAKSQLSIVAEKFWPLEFLLLGLPGASCELIEVVHINPYADAQCQHYLQRYQHWQIEKHASSSKAAQVVQQRKFISHAAIASSNAAIQYQLNIIDQTIFELGEEPIMHFVVLSQSMNISTTENHALPTITSIALHTDNIEKNIAVLRQQSIQISMLRKSHDLPNMYYLDFYGKWDAINLQELFNHETSLHYLGAFPACSERGKYEGKFS